MDFWEGRREVKKRKVMERGRKGSGRDEKGEGKGGEE